MNSYFSKCLRSISIICIGLFLLSHSAVAATNPVNRDATIQSLMQQIAELQKQVNEAKIKASPNTVINGTAPEHHYIKTDDGKTGRTKVTITGPEQKETFYKQDANDPILVAWDARNVPNNSLIEVELVGVKTGSGVTGGTWQGEIPEGDSTGTYEYGIHDAGTSVAGLYKVRTAIRACRPEGCSFRGPGGKIFARSAWRAITIADGDAELGAYKAVLNGSVVDSESAVSKKDAEELCEAVYNDYDQYDFTSGDVLKCYWDKKKFITVTDWKG